MIWPVIFIEVSISRYDFKNENLFKNKYNSDPRQI